MRIHLKKLLRVRSYEQMAKQYPALTEEELDEYDSAPLNDYFQPENFRVDFVRPWSTFDYNLEARDYFIENLLREFEGGGYVTHTAMPVPTRYRDKLHIGAALDTHMEHCRERFRAYHKPPSADELAKMEREARKRARKHTVSFLARSPLASH